MNSSEKIKNTSLLNGVSIILKEGKESTEKIFSSPTVSWDDVKPIVFAIFIFFGLCGIAYGIYWATQPPKNIDIIQALGKRKFEINKNYSSLNGNVSLFRTLLNKLDPLEQYLINLQPLTANIGGFIGSIEENGVFDVEWYVQNALRMGIRSFVLPISTYIDDNKKAPYWPLSEKPAIVYRDANNVIRSLNGLTIKKFCETLQLYTNENPSQKDEPILLHIVPVEGYVPDPVKSEKKYVMLMKDIAEELKTINNQRLMTIGSYGTALGGQRESEILTQVPLKDMMGKILVFTTFDVRVALKDAYNTIRPRLYEYAVRGRGDISR